MPSDASDQAPKSFLTPRNIAIACGVTAGIGAVGYWYYSRRNVKNPAISMPVTLKQKCLDAKQAGNDLFKKALYCEAIEKYSEALTLALDALEKGKEDGAVQNRKDSLKATDIAAAYQNRAAAYEKLDEPEKVVEDCTSALKHNKHYTKAIIRRAKAYNQLKQYRKSLVDYTAGCVLEQFQNQASLEAADAVLKALGRELATEHCKDRGPDDMPAISSTFVESYLASFCEDPVVNSLPFPAENNAPLISGADDASDTLSNNGPVENELSDYEKAQIAIQKRSFADVIPFCSKEIDNPNSVHRHEALLLRATFYLILGQSTKALADFESLFTQLESLPENVARKFRTNAYIKRGSLYMQTNQREQAMADFSLAEQAEPDNADVYHHRGQLLVLLEDIKRAQRDFERSVQLRPDFGIAAVQRSYCNYRAAMEAHSVVDTFALPSSLLVPPSRNIVATPLVRF